MTTRVRAKFTSGHIIPLERLDIEEGAELSIDIDVQSSVSDLERMKKTMSAAGGWKGRRDPEELKRTLYEARLSGSRERPVL